MDMQHHPTHNLDSGVHNPLRVVSVALAVCSLPSATSSLTLVSKVDASYHLAPDQHTIFEVTANDVGIVAEVVVSPRHILGLCL